MKITKKLIRTGALALLGVACCVFSIQAVAFRTMAAEPTVVAVVNLTAVLENLTERADAEIRLREMTERIQTERETQVAQLQQLQDELAEIAETDDETRKAKEDEIVMGEIHFQAWYRFNADKMDIERALSFQDLYRNIKAEIALLAEIQGYDIVLIDDSIGELVINPEAKISREVQIQQQIANRRILFARDYVDITDELTTRMNNAYQAGQ